MHPDRRVRGLALPLFSLSLLAIPITGCAGATNTLHANQPAPPEQAACEVHTNIIAARPDYRRFTSDGRILEGSGSGTYSTSGVERFHYDAEHRLVRIESEEVPSSNPESPRRKTTEVINFYYDKKGLLFRQQSAHRELGSYTVNTETRYRYDDAGRIVETFRKLIDKTMRDEIHYEKGQPVQHDTFTQSRDDKMPQLIGRRRGSYDPAGQLKSVLYEYCAKGKCVPSQRSDYSYDSWGRLTQRIENDLRPKPSARAERWIYDDAGRLAQSIDHDRPTQFTYDQKGLLSAISLDGKIWNQYQYAGSCERARMAPELPNPADEFLTRICINTPLGVLITCFEPRSSAIPRSRRSAATAPLPPPLPKNLGEGTSETDDLQKWIDFKEQDIGFAARFPESPERSDHEDLTIAWARHRSRLLILAVEIYPFTRTDLAPSEILESLFRQVTRTSKPSGSFGDTQSVPAWLQTRKSAVVNGYEALDLEGEYAVSPLVDTRMKKKGRLILIGKLVYFIYAVFAPDDPKTLRAADYFLSSFQPFEGKQPPTE